MATKEQIYKALIDSNPNFGKVDMEVALRAAGNINPAWRDAVAQATDITPTVTQPSIADEPIYLPPAIGMGDVSGIQTGITPKQVTEYAIPAAQIGLSMMPGGALATGTRVALSMAIPKVWKDVFSGQGATPSEIGEKLTESAKEGVLAGGLTKSISIAGKMAKGTGKVGGKVIARTIANQTRAVSPFAAERGMANPEIIPYKPNEGVMDRIWNYVTKEFKGSVDEAAEWFGKSKIYGFGDKSKALIIDTPKSVIEDSGAKSISRIESLVKNVRDNLGKNIAKQRVDIKKAIGDSIDVTDIHLSAIDKAAELSPGPITSGVLEDVGLNKIVSNINKTSSLSVDDLFKSIRDLDKLAKYKPINPMEVQQLGNTQVIARELGAAYKQRLMQVLEAKNPAMAKQYRGTLDAFIDNLDKYDNLKLFQAKSANPTAVKAKFGEISSKLNSGKLRPQDLADYAQYLPEPQKKVFLQNVEKLLDDSASMGYYQIQVPSPSSSFLNELRAMTTQRGVGRTIGVMGELGQTAQQVGGVAQPAAQAVRGIARAEE